MKFFPSTINTSGKSVGEIDGVEDEKSDSELPALEVSSTSAVESGMIGEHDGTKARRKKQRITIW